MSWQASAYVSKLTTTPTGDKLTRSEKLLALLLADRHNPDYDIAWPSVTKLATEALLSERRTRDLLHSLERKGVISIERRWVGPQQCATNLYRFPGLVLQGGGAISSPRRKSSPARHCPRVGHSSLPQGGAIAPAPEPAVNRQRTDMDPAAIAAETHDHDREAMPITEVHALVNAFLGQHDMPQPVRDIEARQAELRRQAEALAAKG
jgi:Helix-turn-helix domain